MDIIINERDKNIGPDQERVKSAIKQLSDQDVSDAQRGALLTLTESMLGYSHSQVLLKLSSEHFLQWMLAFWAFLEHRNELVNVKRFDPPQHDHSYLLVNTLDVSFLVDSLQMLFQRKQVQAVVISHPVFSIRRQAGKLVSIQRSDPEGIKESFMLVQFDRDLPMLDELIDDIRTILGYAQQVGRLRSYMLDRLADLETLAETADQKSFIHWLKDNNFVCFANMTIDLSGKGKQTQAQITKGPFGWIPESVVAGFSPAGQSKPIPAEHLERLTRRNTFVVEILDQPSLLHRDEQLVYLGFRELLGKNLWREHAFVGLFSQNSLNELTFNVPDLKNKVEASLERQHVYRDSYDYRKVVEIFNTFPKVELFFIDTKEMDHLVRSFVSLQRYQTVKVVVTRSLSLRGVTLLLIMPREYYTGGTLRRMEAYLRRYFKADRVSTRIIHFYSQYLSLHVRVVPNASKVRIDIDRLEKMLTEQVRPWGDKLHHLLVRYYGHVKGTQLCRKYLAGLPDEYKALIHPRFATRDIRAVERILDDRQEVFDLWGPFHENREFFRLQFYSLRESCLNELMPFLENLNLSVVDEVDFNVQVDEQKVYIKSFAVRNDQPGALPLFPLRDKLLQILNGLRNGSIEDDYLNRIMVLTGLDWKQIDVFRAYRNYYFQLGNPFTKRRVAFALINNPDVALLLYRYFEARFLPKKEWEDLLQREEQALMPVRMELADALDQVDDINEDRILRSLFNLIDSTVRTNFFLRCNEQDYFLSFKISAIGIIDMPFPRPMYETYVHSASMEGIHLRGGKIARGGIRWSDRPDDFRTEVLGLMKTQMAKNALIVPVGSKGGFVVKTPFATRDEGAELSRDAYIMLMRGLLDLVDNRVSGEVVRPRGVVVYDDLDPYLVVAADKGTAHLPDTANAVSADYGFWLDDAFASGGSVGYDHKKLGITARGAWECVKRHFREVGKDIQTTDFTVVGIGDMSGDVFGNGMLLSRHIRLLAAFNHMHIFIDPDPDPETSWCERKRLFELPRSAWTDYNAELISAGGGVWPRSSKDIPLSPEVRQWLGVRHSSMDGDELIRRLMTADAELLWNGGIGTYVKSSQEKNADVGDRANDNVRVNANHLKVKVVGEGGNLGMTQRARVEYAMAGGRINTDSIDNSAGVDTSDHEVNLKIFIQTLREHGQIKTDRARKKLLFDIQDDVCETVLKNNYTQSLCLSLDAVRCAEDADPFVDLVKRLSNSGLLDPQSEFLPTTKELTSRGVGYVRPELAILLSYSKMQLYQALMESDLPDRGPVQKFLHDYFPELIRKKHGKYLEHHPLRREIIATMITNQVVDHAGCTFLNTLSRQTGATPVQAVAAYLVFDEVLSGKAIREQVFSGDNRMSSERQYELLLQLEGALAGLCSQVVEQGLPMSLDHECVQDYQNRLHTFQTHLKDLLPADEWQVCQEQAGQLVEEGFDESLALQMASFYYLVGFLPAVHIAETTGADLFAVTEVMSELRQRLNFPVVNACLRELVLHDRWDRMAQSGLRSSFIRQFVRLTHAIVSSGTTVNTYLTDRRQRVEYYQGLVETIRSNPPKGTSPFSVLLRALESLAE